MKKKFFSVFFALVLVLSFSLVTAVPAGASPDLLPVEFQEYGDGVAEWSTDKANSGTYSVKLNAGTLGGANAGRIQIDLVDPIPISEFTGVTFFGWEPATTEHGGEYPSDIAQAYPYGDPNINIYLDFNEDGAFDDCLEGVGSVPVSEAAWPDYAEQWTEMEEPYGFYDMDDSMGTGQWIAWPIVAGTLTEWKTWLATNQPLCTVVRVKITFGFWADQVTPDVYVDDIEINGTTYDLEPRVINTTQTTGFNTIQDAIDAADLDDTITVAAGTYREYLHITTDGLTIEGAGIDESIIDLDGLIPSWHYTGGSFASRAGVLIAGHGIDDGIIEGVTFRGFTVQNAGLNPPITATGTATLANADTPAVLTDSTASFPTNGEGLVGQWLHNVSDKLIQIDISGNTPIRSYGLITANTATTVTATLAGGLENDWDTGDTYVVMPYEQYVDVAEDLQDDVRGIIIGNGKDVSILYCKVINSGYGGINVGKDRIGGLYSEGVTIDHCISSDNPQVGISVGDYLGPVTITNNTCSNNKRPHPTDPSREYAGVGIQVSGKKGGSIPLSGLIAGNTCSNNGFEGIVLKKYADGVTVENNTVTGSNFDEDGAGIFFYGDKSNPENCQNNIITNNTVTGNIRGIVAYYAQNCTIGGDTAAEGNTITTDSGAFDSGQAAIKIDGGNNIVVKNNTISNCDGVGIRVTNTWNDVASYENIFLDNTITDAKFAGVRITKGAYDNTFVYNTITGTTSLMIGAGKEWEDTQGDGVFIDDDAGAGNVFHWNDIHGNADDGMENQTGTPVDATNNWWGAVSGPYHVTTNPSGTGDPVSDNVDYMPWLLTEGGDPFDKVLLLPADWSIVSPDSEITDWYVGSSVGLVYAYDKGAFVEVTTLDPITPVFIKTANGGWVGFNYAESSQGIFTTDLEAGWNLIGIPETIATATAILSPIRLGANNEVALATLASQGNYNPGGVTFYESMLNPASAVPMLYPFDGYWAYMNVAKEFGVIVVEGPK